jgi:hypothetical protein
MKFETIISILYGAIVAIVWVLWSNRRDCLLSYNTCPKCGSSFWGMKPNKKSATQIIFGGRTCSFCGTDVTNKGEIRNPEQG